MSERLRSPSEQTKTISGPQQLYALATQGSLSALQELSCMAASGSENAQQLVEKIDRLDEGGEINFHSSQEPQPSLPGGHLFALTHPLTTLRAFRRLIDVRMEAGGPPSGWIFEDFAELSIPEAARVIWESERGGIPSSAWSAEDQKRLQQGKRPKGIPEHPNV